MYLSAGFIEKLKQILKYLYYKFRLKNKIKVNL